MVRLYLDEDMSSRVAQALRGKGFDVLRSHEVGNEGLSDEEQLCYAAQEGRHLVTYNAWQARGTSRAGVSQKSSSLGRSARPAMIWAPRSKCSKNS